MSISENVRQQMVEGSWIRRMFEEGAALKAMHGADKVCDLSLGNPIAEPPEEFISELRRIVNNPVPGMHRYMPNAGYEETRRAVAAELERETGVSVTSRDVVITCGAAGAMNAVLKTLLNPGEEVIVLAPYFVEFLGYVDNHGGKPRVVKWASGFLPDLSAIESAIGRQTKAIIMNSPNNPTGVVYPERVVRALGELLARKEAELGTQIYLISDEPYRRILFDEPADTVS